MPRPPKTCRETAWDMLSRREHAVAEVRRKLRSKKFPPAEVEAVVADLMQKGLLSDSRYAVARARYRAGASRWGWLRIAQELRAVGIGDEDIAAARADLAEEGINFAEQAATLATRRLKDGSREARQKAMAALVRKGYSLVEARAAVEAAAESA